MDNINIINDDEIKLTPQQRANKKYYEKIKNNPEYKARFKTDTHREQMRKAAHKFYQKVKDNEEFKKKVSDQKRQYYINKRNEFCLLEISV